MQRGMDEPEVRSSRIAIALAALVAVAVGGGGFLIGRTFAPHPPAAVDSAPREPVTRPTVLPAESLTLSRGDLVSLAAKGADALSSGAPLPPDVRGSAGRRFELLIPFGCGGPSAGTSESAFWTYDKAQGRLRISVTPTGWQAGDWNLGEAPGLEAIEGFWVDRPWSSSTDCPAAPEQTEPAPEATENTPPPDKQPAAEPERTLAVAQIFLADGTRGIRRANRPYSIVTRVAPEQFDGTRGFRLRLTGRIDRTPNGEPVQCVQPGGAQQRPACLIATVLDEVRIEDPASGEALATWRANHSGR